MTTHPPIEWRELIAAIFVEAERHGLGRFEPGFTATPGREDDAARFIGERADHLGPTRLGRDTAADTLPNGRNTS